MSGCASCSDVVPSAHQNIFFVQERKILWEKTLLLTFLMCSGKKMTTSTDSFKVFWLLWLQLNPEFASMKKQKAVVHTNDTLRWDRGHCSLQPSWLLSARNDLTNSFPWATTGLSPKACKGFAGTPALGLLWDWAWRRGPKTACIWGFGDCLKAVLKQAQSHACSSPFGCTQGQGVLCSPVHSHFWAV